MNDYKITSKDFRKIASTNQFFFWHFTIDDKPWLELHPYEVHMVTPVIPNPLIEIVDTFNIPYFESEVKKEVDFIIQLKNGFVKRVWNPKQGFAPVILAFKGYKLLYNTWDDFCYCSEGFIDMIYNTNPDYFNGINSKESTLSIEKENLE